MWTRRSQPLDHPCHCRQTRCLMPHHPWQWRWAMRSCSWPVHGFYGESKLMYNVFIPQTHEFSFEIRQFCYCMSWSIFFSQTILKEAECRNAQASFFMASGSHLRMWSAPGSLRRVECLQRFNNKQQVQQVYNTI